MTVPGCIEGTKKVTPMRAKTGAAQASTNHCENTSPPLAAERSEADRMLRAMTDVLAHRRPASAAEALKVLRLGYPDIPLAMRIAALCADAK
jgi:hypothetical protein